MDLENALHALAHHPEGVLPAEAMRWLQQNPEEAAPAILAKLDRALAVAEPELEDELFFGIHILGDLNETRAHAPLCRLARDAEQLEDILGEAVTGTFENILLRTFDGDVEPLKSVIQDRQADEFARAAALDTLKLLAVLGRIPYAEMVDYLRALPGLLEHETNFVWATWVIAAGQLGLEDLRPQAKKAFDREWIPYYSTSLREFDDDIAAVRAEPDPTKIFASELRRLFDDSVDELSKWHGFSQAYREELANPKTPRQRPILEGLGGRKIDAPASNPLRDVGRNDPCPCGSGKKFKKCYIDKPLDLRA